MMNPKYKAIVKDYALMTIGCILYAVCWEGFMIPNDMSAGGLMGLCTVIQYATAGAVKASFLYVAFNVLLILIAILAMGIAFGVRTLYCIAACSVALDVASRLEILKALPGHFFFVPDPVLIPIIAGALEAVAVGFTLRAGGSTGGTDIIALMVNKYWPISLGRVFLVTDFMVICSMLLLPEKAFSDCVYGFEMMITFSLMIDWVIGGSKSSFQLMVFSEKYNEIADYIIDKMDRGVTVLRAQGWFTKRDKNVLLILINQKQFPALSKVIKQIDPRAFMSVSKTSNVYGEGFEEIKGGVALKKER